MSQQKQIGLAIQIYMDESDSYLMPMLVSDGGGRRSNMIAKYWGGESIGIGLLIDHYDLPREITVCPGRSEHGAGYNIDYVLSWPQRGGPDVFRKEHPNLSYFQYESAVAAGGAGNHKGRRIMMADVRTRDNTWRVNPADIPHKGGCNILIDDGSVEWKNDIFGPAGKINLLPNSWAGIGDKDRNARVNHDWGSGWWYWMEREYQGF